MTMAERIDPKDMASVKARLDEIVDAVGDEAISLDDALSFYEEAVKLGMRASELMESQLVGDDAVQGVAAASSETAQGE